MSRSALRYAALGALAVLGIGLAVLLGRAELRPPLETSFTGAFQVVGAPLKLADRMTSRVLPVGALDERELGDVLRRSLDAQLAREPTREQAYLDSLMAEIQPFTGRPFHYRAYVVWYYGPNAMALPGGVVLVTHSLLSTLHSEAELVSVLAHEVGHIERGHCFDAVRFELLARKVGAEPLGALADLGTQILFAHSYSKNLEHEADDYAFELLANSRYDPAGESGAFRSLQRWEQRARVAGTPQRASPMRDYFTSHPPLEIRSAEYAGRAQAWWARHPQARRYVGQRNLAGMVARRDHDIAAEWVGAPPAQAGAHSTQAESSGK